MIFNYLNFYESTALGDKLSVRLIWFSYLGTKALIFFGSVQNVEQLFMISVMNERTSMNFKLRNEDLSMVNK